MPEQRMKLILEMQNERFSKGMRQSAKETQDMTDALDQLAKRTTRLTDLARAAGKVGASAEEIETFKKEVQELPEDMESSLGSVTSTIGNLLRFLADASAGAGEQVDQLGLAFEELKAGEFSAGIKDAAEAAVVGAHKYAQSTNVLYLAITKSAEIAVNMAKGVDTVFQKLGNTINDTLSKVSGFADQIESDDYLAAAGQFERFTTTLEAFSKSAKLAQQELEFLSNFAASTPFDLPGLVEADIQLKAFGVSAQRYLPLAANLAAVAHRTVAESATALGKALSGIPEGLTQLQESYRITTRDLRAAGAEYDEHGRILQSTIGQTRKLAEAIQRVNNTKLGDQLTKASETLEGRLSNLRDAVTRFKTAIGEAMLPAAKAFVSSLTTIVEGLNKLTPLLKYIAVYMTDFGNSVSWVTQKIAAFAAGCVGATEKVFNFGKGILTIVDNAGKAVSDLGGLSSKVKVLGDVAGATVGKLGEFGAIMAAVGGTIGVIAAPFAILGLKIGILGQGLGILAKGATVAAETFGVGGGLATALTTAGEAAAAAGASAGLIATGIGLVVGSVVALGVVAALTVKQWHDNAVAAEAYAQATIEVIKAGEKQVAIGQLSIETLRKQGYTAKDASRYILGLREEIELLSNNKDAGSKARVKELQAEITKAQGVKKALAELEEANKESYSAAIEYADKAAAADVKFRKDQQKNLFENIKDEADAFETNAKLAAEAYDKIKKLRDDATKDEDTLGETEEYQERIKLLDKYQADLEARSKAYEQEQAQITRSKNSYLLNQEKSHQQSLLALGKISQQQYIASLKNIIDTFAKTKDEQLDLQREYDQAVLASQRSVQDASLAVEEEASKALEQRINLAERALDHAEDAVAAENELKAAINAKFDEEADLLTKQHRLEIERETDKDVAAQKEKKFQEELKNLETQRSEALLDAHGKEIARNQERIKSIQDVQNAEDELLQAQLAASQKKFDNGDRSEATQAEILSSKRAINEIARYRIEVERQSALQAANLTEAEKLRINKTYNAKLKAQKIQADQEMAEIEKSLAVEVHDKKVELLASENEIREAQFERLQKRFDRGDTTAGPKLAELRKQLDAAEILSLDSERKKQLIGVKSTTEIARINALYANKTTALKLKNGQREYDEERERVSKINQLRIDALQVEEQAISERQAKLADDVKLGLERFDIAKKERGLVYEMRAVKIATIKAQEKEALAAADASQHARIRKDFQNQINAAQRDSLSQLDSINDKYKTGNSLLDKRIAKLERLRQRIQQAEQEQEIEKEDKEDGRNGEITPEEAQRRKDRDDQLRKDKIKAKKEEDKVNAEIAKAERNRRAREEQEAIALQKQKDAYLKTLREQGKTEEEINRLYKARFGTLPGEAGGKKVEEPKLPEDKSKDSKLPTDTKKKGEKDTSQQPTLAPMDQALVLLKSIDQKMDVQTEIAKGYAAGKSNKTSKEAPKPSTPGPKTDPFASQNTAPKPKGTH